MSQKKGAKGGIPPGIKSERNRFDWSNPGKMGYAERKAEKVGRA